MPTRRQFSASQKAQIVLEALKEDKTIAQIASENGVHPNQIHKWKRQALENFAQLFAEDRQGEKAREAEHERQLNELYAEIGRLSAQLSWLKKNLAFTRNRVERLAMVEKGHPEIPLKVQAELLGISYSSLFYQPVPPSERELRIKRRIDEIYTDHPYYWGIVYLTNPNIRAIVRAERESTNGRDHIPPTAKPERRRSPRVA